MVDLGFRVDEGSKILYDRKWVNFNVRPLCSQHHFVTHTILRHTHTTLSMPRVCLEMGNLRARHTSRK
jgi:hypothetical protein